MCEFLQYRPTYGHQSELSKWRLLPSWIFRNWNLTSAQFTACCPVSTSTPNLVKIHQRAAELWRFMCFQNGGRPPSWVFAEVKFGGISVSGTSVLVQAKFYANVCNCDRVMAVKVNFQNGGRRHLGLFVSEIWRHRKSRAARIYLHTKFGEDISTGGRVMAIYVFSTWRLSAILNYNLAILDHPRSFLVDLKLVFKFCVDRIYICKDISDQTFRKFGLKRLFAPPKFTFRGFWPLNITFHHQDPQKALPWRKTRAMSHHALKLVQRCGQDAVRRIQKQEACSSSANRAKPL